jgi:hypothetical protein
MFDSVKPMVAAAALCCKLDLKVQTHAAPRILRSCSIFKRILLLQALAKIEINL